MLITAYVTSDYVQPMDIFYQLESSHGLQLLEGSNKLPLSVFVPAKLFVSINLSSIMAIPLSGSFPFPTTTLLHSNFRFLKKVSSGRPVFFQLVFTTYR